jgi:DNA-binding CsgD family transcriptional regulator
MAENTGSTEAPQKREEQVLILAAGGLTDKEIAVKLGISPDTVGTYWRRILAKYQAASRTEVVAKYAEDRGKAAVENLQYVNECLKLVNEHLLDNASRLAGMEPKAVPTEPSPAVAPAQSQPAPTISVGDNILAIVTDWIVLLDKSGKIIFSNKPIPTNVNLAKIVDNPDLDEILELASKTETDTELDVANDFGGKLDPCYSFRFWPGVQNLSGHIVGIGRAF